MRNWTVGDLLLVASKKLIILCKQYTSVLLLKSFCSRLMAFSLRNLVFILTKYNNLSGGKSPLDTLLSVLQVFSISEAPSGKRDAHHTCQRFFCHPGVKWSSFS